MLWKRDESRILELETAVKQLGNDVQALKNQWDTELVALSNIKEQVNNAISRLDMRAKRAKPKEEPEPAPPRPVNPLAERLLQGAPDGVLPR